jgi:hypothetical protein
MSALAEVPFHDQAPCGEAQSPDVTMPGAAASSDHRQEPLTKPTRPPASMVKARSVDCSGT